MSKTSDLNNNFNELISLRPQCFELSMEKIFDLSLDLPIELFHLKLYSQEEILEEIRRGSERARLFNPESIDWDDVYEVSSVIKYAPQFFDSEKFNWFKHSHHIVKKNTSLFESKKFNWEDASWAIPPHAPELFDKDLFNWEEFSVDVLEHSPELLDCDLFNWEISPLEIRKSISISKRFKDEAPIPFIEECILKGIIDSPKK